MAKSKKKGSSAAAARESPKKLWCFTINNPTITKEDLLTKLAPFCSYLVIGDEIGEEKTPHLQGYLELETKKRFNSLKLLFAPIAPHLESKSNGSTRGQAAAYCKKDGKFVEHGVAPPVGKKGNGNRALASMCTCLVEGKPLSEVMLNDPATYVRNYRGLQDFEARLLKVPIIRKMTTILLFGATGAGKTHWCFQNFPELFKKPIGKSLWFDGYQAQKTILIDEFTGQYPLSDMLQIMDQYPTQVERKGSHTLLACDLLLLTTNIAPSTYYEGWKNRFEQQLAFARRISKIMHFIEKDNIMEYTDPEQIKDFVVNFQ